MSACACRFAPWPHDHRDCAWKRTQVTPTARPIKPKPRKRLKPGERYELEQWGIVYKDKS